MYTVVIKFIDPLKLHPNSSQRNVIKLLRRVVIPDNLIYKYALKKGPDELILLTYLFIFESRSIISSSPAVTFRQPACQAHSVQCAAKDSLSCVSMCVKGLVVVSGFLIYSMRRIGKHYYGLAQK